MKHIFPRSFRFGVADADLQVIGEDATIKEEQSQKTMWYHFAQNSGKVVNNDTPGRGIDRYHLWDQDIELMKQLGITHYRTSVSMARLMQQNGKVNTNALTWYRNYFAAIRKADIQIYATLYHWELPQYLSEKGGWKNRKIIEPMIQHAQLVHENLGEFIEEYFILNEPWVAAIRGYYDGEAAPGETNLQDALLASHHMLLAQGLVQQTLARKDPQLKLNTVVNVSTSYPATPTPNDMLAARYFDGYLNRWFLDPLYLGQYPTDMIELYGKHVPQFSKEDMQIINIGNKLNAIGINYYFSNLIKWEEKSDLHFAAVTKEGSTYNGLGWVNFVPPLYQEGLYDILTQLYFSYRDHGLKKLYITENGTALAEDTERIPYLKEHIHQVYKALERGVPVDAYFLWTLMDNYEWQRGYGPETSFGIIKVDRQSMKRTLKKSAKWYSKLISTQTLS